jgi:hypothetical protein
MGVLDRKLFAPVRMHAGGSPPHAPVGHKHSFDSERSDEQVINTQKNLETDEGAFAQAMTDAEYFSKQMYPEKTKAEYLAEAQMLFDSDYEAEKQAIARQKEEDKVSSLITFGARLASGRGDPLTILSEATQQTVPELMAMRRATRAEETAVAREIKGEKAKIKHFALSEEKEDEVKRAQSLVERFYNISDQNFELKKMSTEHQHKLKSQTQTAWDKELKANVFVPLGQLLANPKRYVPEHKIGEPFEVFDTHSGNNVLFTDANAFDAAQKLAPSRYESARDDTKGVKRQFTAQFTHPTTGERLNRPGFLVREMKDGSMWIPDVKPQKEGENLSINDRIILDSSGHAKLIPLGTGTADLVLLKDVEMTANDIIGPKLMNELFGQALLYSDNIDSLSVVIDRAINQPDSVGIKGTVDYIKQVGAGVLSDFMGENALSTALTNAVAEGSTFLADDSEISQEVLDKYGGNQAQQIQDLLNADALKNNAELQKKIFGNFKPELADNRARINAIVYALARARKSTGRLNMDDIQRAYADIKITGAIDSATVAVKLTTIKGELLRAHRRTRLMYIHGGGDAGDILPLNYGAATSYQGGGAFNFSVVDGVVDPNWTAGGSSGTNQ